MSKKVSVEIEQADNGFIVTKRFRGGDYGPSRSTVHVFQKLNQAMAMVKDCLSGKLDTKEGDYADLEDEAVAVKE